MKTTDPKTQTDPSGVYIQRKSDGKYLADVRADGRLVLNCWRDRGINYAGKEGLAQFTLRNLGKGFEIVKD